MKSAAAFLRRHLDDVVDLMYPRSCTDCGEPAGDRVPFPHLCEACVRRIHWVRSPACPTCGYPFFGVIEADRQCPHCFELRPRFRAGRTAVVLKGPARELVHGLKYRGQRHLLRDMRAILERAGELLEFVRGGVLVPVPLHPRKQRERGFNQSRLIANLLASLSGDTRVEEPLCRVVDTETQTRFDRSRRRDNLKNAFAICSGVVLNKKTRYVLIDDVFTTGATLNACAAVLRKRRAGRIDVATFGHG